MKNESGPLIVFRLLCGGVCGSVDKCWHLFYPLGSRCLLVPVPRRLSVKRVSLFSYWCWSVQSVENVILVLAFFNTSRYSSTNGRHRVSRQVSFFIYDRLLAKRGLPRKFAHVLRFLLKFVCCLTSYFCFLVGF